MSKIQKGLPPLPWPESALEHDPVALANFKQLCECCDREGLSIILARIVTPQSRRRDSWEAAADGMSLGDMAKIAAQAREFTATLERVRKTVLVKHLARQGRIPVGDLLHRSTRLRCLDSITRLDLLARESGIGPSVRPDFAEDIEHLAAIVKKGCGRYHYEKLDQILSALGQSINVRQFRSDRKRARTRRKKDLP
jgi:hypothetical protein